MADVSCPQCGRPNPDNLDTCQFCGAELAPSGTNPWQMHPGEVPTRKDTSEFDKVALPPADEQTIHPGDEPTKKNTAELEQALPSWLRSLRAKKDESGSQAPAEPPIADLEPPAPAPSGPAPAIPGPGAASPGEMPDWIAGLGAASAPEEEEIPEWLTSLRGGGPEAGGPQAPAAPAAAPAADDWMSALSGQPEKTPPPAPASSGPAPTVPGSTDESLPDWLEGLQAGGATPTETGAPKDTGELSAWLSNLPPSETAYPGVPAPASSGPAPAVPGPASELPPSATQPGPGSGAAEELPDWLKKLKEKAAETQPELPPTPIPDSTPDWLAGIQPEAEAEQPPAAPAESIPDWLAKLENQAGTGASTAMPSPFVEGTPPQTGGLGGATPDWLAKLQAEAAPLQEPPKEEFEVSSEPLPAAAPAEGLPDWLANIEEPAPPAAATPALIVGNEEKGPSEPGPAAFSMETPDWLSKLKPEEGSAPGPAPAAGEGQSPDALQRADLPSWVQAMRPVEDVVAEAKSEVVDNKDQPLEEKGPLAGLRGVLPAGPGLGSLRKPPAYSVKLQASETQQRFATHLEDLIKSETEAITPHASQPIASRLMRWIVAAVLIFVIVIPIATGLQVTPSNAVYPQETVALVNLVNALPPNSPVLVVFDYEPALSGELEAAAAPVIDHLLLISARLTFISTTPTGPALAERLMHGTQAGHNPVSGQQYVNLGYLAGGPAGVLDFVSNPSGAAPLAYSNDPAVNEKPAWAQPMPPLVGVHALSDFKLVIVLTDNADTGRVWIEQAGPALGVTPLAMVISAQAEPMLRPYYDSGQVKGMVTGLAGGKAYEQATGRPGLGATYWNAFSAGLLVTELLIVGGGLWGILELLRNRRAKNGGKA